MFRVLKASFLSLNFILAFGALCAIASHAGGPDKVGWKVVFTIDGCQGDVTVGGNDNGSGYHIYPITGPVAASLADGYGSQIHSGSTNSFTETLSVTPSATAPKMFDLNWSTYNWEPVGLYQAGNLWPMFNVSGVLVEGNDTTVLDLNRSGSTTLMAGYNSQLTMYANPSVPEPVSVFTIGGGFGALLLRRFRFSAWLRK